MKILITGGSGLLAPYIVEAFSGSGDVMTTSRKDAEYPCDLTDKAEVLELVEKINPDVIVHLAAMTNVDYCEEHPDEAHAANVTATAHLVEAVSGSDCYLIYVSTDQVYPDGPGLFSEGQVDPVNQYGASKYQGEEAARRHPNSLIARINIVGPSRTPGRSSLSDFFTNSFAEGKHISLFQDVLFSPLHMETLAQLLLQCYRKKLTGTYNIGSHDGMSKKDFALKLAEYKGLDASNVTIVNSSDMAGRAVRPRDLRLNVAFFEQKSGIKLPSLQEEIEKL
ncbi:SDR family oxidoreductase [Emcibacter nanhaiensis]|uniref:SDR family oxidoreductase n=1 Tax=Emcibacter nanhaiensis TaxID=1505037 RepID=A0A501PQL3_9PROT|nr:SDR family oxidoreductase [Emcibacter nanhaiensis]TPD62820.1 SDR family oxidoreductase [Emcibacter nanhaiensis]